MLGIVVMILAESNVALSDVQDPVIGNGHPVEYQLPGIQQAQVSPSIWLTRLALVSAA